MQAIKQNIIKQGTNIILYNDKSKAEISLINGGSLTQLTLNNSIIIKDFSNIVTYKDSYASAILFPFANRILNGEYEYLNQKYQLEKNSSCNTNAIHGLIYNKPFKLTSKENSKNAVSATLTYKQETKENGFPFLFSVSITYTLTNNQLDLNVTINNNDNSSLPFTIGWHPYFYSKDIANSILEINSDKEIIHDQEMIPIKTENNKTPYKFKIGNKKLDNCYLLKNNFIGFKTPDYLLKITSSFNNNYIQIYTPDLENHIAIEPITGPSNSFNNKLGLQTLPSKEEFNIQWTIQLKNE
ncbi:aldose 1-epimerase [Tenacibaculum aiptasiae]|uniref:aldose 1-epimerase n=1 Tax=Tenacibaculum aiptasiae TaxID=426481 RepID=UPI00232EE3CC|nr:aldose 1-epimerase [Tenacibaculum aiptasiae]